MTRHDTLFSLLFKIYRFVYMVSIDDMTNFRNNIIFTSYHIINLRYFSLTLSASAIVPFPLILTSFIFSFSFSLYNDTYKKKLNRKDI